MDVHSNMNKALSSGLLAVVGSIGVLPAQAQNSAWLGEPGTGYLSLSYVHQSADEFYAGTTKMPTPQNEDLRQGTVWASANYFLSDAVALDLRSGWAKSEFTTGPGIPTSSDSFSGLIDTYLGVTWRLTDEWTSNAPSIALRAGTILAGDYDTGHINALGDGGDGYEASVIVAKFLGENLGVSAEVGRRDRNDDIPTSTFVNAMLVWLVGDKLSLGLDYEIVDTESSLDIGGEGFTPPKFPQVQEEWRTVGGRLYYDVGENLTMTMFYSKRLTGRNTPLLGAYGATFSYSFGG